MKRFNPKELEPRIRKFWDEKQVYKANLNSDKPKYIAMSMFNYPSGAGIHIGHAMNYTISDVLARVKRQQGYESYHPVGWDAFGLPAENYAIKAGVSPQESMAKIIPSYHKQYKAMGWSNDWSKEISTHLPEYYKWSQWIFSEMYRAGMAYQDARTQWWCTKCQTVLANEQVIDDKCWRHDAPDDPIVEKKEVKQWFFKITDYADELLEAIDDLDWTESVKLAQKNWIGKSKGAEVDFKIVDSEGSDASGSDEHEEAVSNGASGTKTYREASSANDDKVIAESDGGVSGSARKQDNTTKSIRVFTTRPDTLFGATFMVLAPEHPLVKEYAEKSENKEEIDKYVSEAIKKSDVDREKQKDKTGVEIKGLRVINPVNDQEIPVWVADYVLYGYGTGAIMAVPAHDERDNEFATKYKINTVKVVEPKFVTTEGGGAVKKDEDFVKRNAVCVVVFDPNTDKYLCMKWKTHKLHGLITGGIEEGEDLVEAAKREVLEETGYKNLKFVTDPEIAIHCLFYHQQKKQNRWARFNYVFFELENEERETVGEEESKKLEAVWVPKDELTEFFTVEEGEFIVDYLDSRKIIHTGEGVMINSGEYDGMFSSETRDKIVADLEKKGLAKEKTQYKINDWSVSRQRYWGAPIPIIHCDDCGDVLIEDKDLPVVLPELEDFQPSGDGRSALARAKDWLEVDCPKCGKKAERETDTLDTYICSSWYMLRYMDPFNSKEIFDKDITNKWMPIDFYNGADHATAHMIYARFITRFFHKKGLLDNPEPFKKFLFNGKVTASDGRMFSKSKGNGVDPLEIIDNGYGADALRTYLMFAAPLDQWVRWDENGVPGCHRFLNRLWTLNQEYLEAEKSEAKAEGKSKQLLRLVNKTIYKVTHDIEELKYNTAISAMMAAVNELYKIKAEDNYQSKEWKFALESMAQIVAPFAPHMAEAMWRDLGNDDSVQVDHWPKWDEKYLVDDMITIVVQVNGKVRANIEVSAGAAEDEIKEKALSDQNVQKYVENKKPTKIIYVPGRLVNVVV